MKLKNITNYVGVVAIALIQTACCSVRTMGTDQAIDVLQQRSFGQMGCATEVLNQRRLSDGQLENIKQLLKEQDLPKSCQPGLVHALESGAKQRANPVFTRKIIGDLLDLSLELASPQACYDAVGVAQMLARADGITNIVFSDHYQRLVRSSAHPSVRYVALAALHAEYATNRLGHAYLPALARDCLARDNAAAVATISCQILKTLLDAEGPGAITRIDRARELVSEVANARRAEGFKTTKVGIERPSRKFTDDDVKEAAIAVMNILDSATPSSSASASAARN